MATEEEESGVKIVADKYRSFLHDEAQNTEWRHGGPPTYDAEWAKGSLEEVVQNAIKSWEMELSHKTRVQDFRTINPDKFKLIVNGELRIVARRFPVGPPRGFAWEVVAVYSGPPVIAFKFRHWGYFEGPFKGHAPTGEMVQFYGVGVLKVDESLRAEDVEIYYDPAELFGGLLKGPSLSDHQQKQIKCPFQK
ncbi:hypothetical protein DH2020_031260 [Rehmannia glutinosa]|uniref:Pathogen-related protein n=1 Tax=Rehmannia glutinosa TaxID=99300 RepID=A0ABR0VIN5_REHGL